MSTDAPRSRAGAGAVAAVLAVLVWLAAVVGAPAAAAAALDPAAPAPAVAAPAVGLTIEDSSPAVLQPGEELRLRVRVTAPSATALDGARVLLSGSSPVLADATAVQRWADGDGDVRGNLQLEEALLVPGPAVAQEPIDVRFDVLADPEQIGGFGAQWGARGITVEVLDAAGQRLASARTFVVWLPRGVPQESAAVTVLVPFSAGPPAVADARVPAERMAELTAPGGRLERLLRVAAVPGTAWAIDPLVLASASAPPGASTAPPVGAGAEGAAGAAGPQEPGAQEPGAQEPGAQEPGAQEPGAQEPGAQEPGAQEPGAGEDAAGDAATGADGATGAATWAGRLADLAAQHEVVALPQADPDLEGLAAAGQGHLYSLADQQGAATVQLLLGAAARSDVAVVGGRRPSVESLALAEAAGRTAVVLGTGEGGADLPARVDLRSAASAAGGTVQVAGLVPSAGASRALTEGTTRQDAADAAGAPTLPVTIARLLAESAVTARAGGAAGAAGGGTPMLLTPSRTWDVDPLLAERALAALRGAPWVRTSSLAALLAVPATLEVDPAAAAPVPDPAGPPQHLDVGGLRAAGAALARAQETAGAVADPAARLDAVEASAVAAVSATWLDDLPGWAQAVAQLTEIGAGVDRQVRVVPGSAVTVLASEVGLPVTVANDLQQRVDVQVSLRSTSARLQPEGGPVAVSLEPGDRQQVLLPVTAVASGDITVQVVLATPSGVPIGTPAPLAVRVRAEWEGRGTAAVAGVLAVVLVVGVARTVRRNRRRDRFADPLADPLADPAADPVVDPAPEGSGAPATQLRIPDQNGDPAGGPAAPPAARTQDPSSTSAGAGGPHR